MKKVIPWLIVIAVLLIGVLLYRYYESRNRLQVDPRAAEEIEKAKRR